MFVDEKIYEYGNELLINYMFQIDVTQGNDMLANTL